MGDESRTVFDNVLVLAVDPPGYIEDVAAGAYKGHYNEFEWWGLVPDTAPPEHRGFTMEERGGREVEVNVDTFDEPLTVWAERVAVTHPGLYVALMVDDRLVGRWRGGIAVTHLGT